MCVCVCVLDTFTWHKPFTLNWNDKGELSFPLFVNYFLLIIANTVSLQCLYTIKNNEKQKSFTAQGKRELTVFHFDRLEVSTATTASRAPRYRIPDEVSIRKVLKLYTPPNSLEPSLVMSTGRKTEDMILSHLLKDHVTEKPSYTNKI